MKTVLVAIAPGFEEIETITVVDILRRAGARVTLAGTVPGILKGSRDIKLEPDDILDNIGEKVFPGSLGENILIHGFGDLSNVSNKHIMKIGSDVVLKINGQNQPCSTLNSIDKRVLKLIIGKRGLLATVESTGIIRKDDEVKIYKK